MRKLCSGSLAATVGLMLTGCGQQSPAVDPVAAVAQLSTGAPLLRCRTDCMTDWRRAQPYAAQLEAVERWSELAALIISINYQDDLTLYYLARPPRGWAIRRLRSTIITRARTSRALRCPASMRAAYAVALVLPGVALARIEALESEAKRSQPLPPSAPRHRSKAAA